MGRGRIRKDGTKYVWKQKRDSDGVPLVDYDKWGKQLDYQEVKDEEGNVVGYISDETRWDYAPEIRPVTKKDVLNDIDGWRNDDGTYGDADTAIYFAYKDGSFVTAEDLDGKKYKTRGLVGVSISTPDYEMVWGGEVNSRTGEVDMWETHETDDDGNPIDGHTNSYSGYKAVSRWMERVKTTYNNPNGRGGYRTKHETLRRSTRKAVE